MDSLLAFAAVLERRDADVAVRLDELEARQREVEAVRSAVAQAALQLQRLPQVRKAHDRDESAALDARGQALTALREAEEQVAGAREAERPTAERRLDDARASLQRVERELEEFERQHDALDKEERDAVKHVAAAAQRATALGAEVDAAGPWGSIVDAVEEWGSRERGALLVLHSRLVRERDAVVREASELLGSVLGDAAALTSVAGLRARLERALTA